MAGRLERLLVTVAPTGAETSKVDFPALANQFEPQSNAAFCGPTSAAIVLNALMGLPPVVVGLVVYLLLSRSGPLGFLGILFTPQAMIITQTLLVLPIIAALTRQTVEDLWLEYRDELCAMGVRPLAKVCESTDTGVTRARPVEVVATAAIRP
mgnify:CR=1 FL=1